MLSLQWSKMESYLLTQDSVYTKRKFILSKKKLSKRLILYCQCRNWRVTCDAGNGSSGPFSLRNSLSINSRIHCIANRIQLLF